jgi:hypothetical protein
MLTLERYPLVEIAATAKSLANLIPKAPDFGPVVHNDRERPGEASLRGRIDNLRKQLLELARDIEARQRSAR